MAGGTGAAESNGLIRGTFLMQLYVFLLFIAFVSSPAIWSTPNCRSALALRQSLTQFAKKSEEPWMHHEANSEQRQPMYLGANPREMVFEDALKLFPSIREKLKRVGEEHALKLAKILGTDKVEFEAWPFQNDYGDQTWAFARWRSGPGSPWRWLDSNDWTEEGTFHSPSPGLPIVLNPRKKADHAQLFVDFLKQESLYAKPVFGDAIWTNRDGSEILGAWLPLDSQSEKEKEFTKKDGVLARILPQPARFNHEPISFVVGVEGGKVHWPKEIQWMVEHRTEIRNSDRPVPKMDFPKDYAAQYRALIEKLSGEKPVIFKSGEQVTFNRKNSADPQNQLEKFADYLEEYYHDLGLKTIRQRFLYRGYWQSNVIAIIPGTLEKSKNTPVLFADHYDTAFQEDYYEKTKQRVSAPGADDNLTATASLMMAAKSFKNNPPRHDIWLTHLTGEEYPADDLGVRHLLNETFRTKQKIKGMVLIDMIGHRDVGETKFQVNPGRGQVSERLANYAFAASAKVAPHLDPQLRERFDELSYLYNTDGYLFDNMGFPTVYFNENLNRTNIETKNPHYHKSSDATANVDFNYAVPISQAATLTALQLANEDQ